ncbi:hypothetical protein [Arsenophonus nasoniae]|uniref:Uncharacterized protein n=1 Tax=Arsenophonus nasoniae TaxID=638 RepID=A0AA95K1M9_9GAMM|nr:hypothetical protein [Arsenophonus nasoniae]WGL93742.1 hypothetical protein QE207_00320 [Arsenophonus nasoniae]WGL96046.1 hypothetical protein QE207_05525 [Arsenophonus nasoniae]
MSVWDKFGKLETLKIDISERSDQWNRLTKATIYGNGKNQATIYVKINIIGLDGNRLIIPEDELLKAVHIVHYEEGKRLNRKNNNSNYKPWIYTDEDFGYAKLVSGSDYLESAEVNTYESEQVVKFYLYATEPNEGFKISAGIDIPGVGDFNTSERGTITRNGPEGKTGSAFKYPHFVHINAIEPLDFSKSENITVDSSRREISNKIKISRMGFLKDIFYFKGVSKLENIGIKPKEIKSYDNNTFKVINIDGPKKADLNTVKFYDNKLPDVIFGMGGDSFSSYFVFVGQQRGKYLGLMPGSCIYTVEETTNVVYKYELDQYDDHHKTFHYGLEISTIQCNMPLMNVGKLNWCNQNENATFKVDVIDSYGTSGIITIESHYGISSKNNITINGK